jgi:mannonate dehydratase
VITLTELLSPRPTRLWHLIRQCGVENVVALLRGGEQDQRMFASVGVPVVDPVGRMEAPPWGEQALTRDVELFASHGLRVVGIEDTAPMDDVRVGGPRRDEQIENILTQVRAMGRLGITTLCYNWMARSSWGRTEIDRRGRGDALVTGYRSSVADAMPPLADEGEITTEQMWSALQYFLDAVIPVAESVGVRLAMHPDDPPRSAARNVPRIMGSAESYERLMHMHPSPSNKITFCQGNFALMGRDLPGLIRKFGAQQQIVFVHLRDVQGTVDDFVETFHDEGQTDLPACMRAYQEIGFDGLMRPDHVPTLHGESNDRPGYADLARLFAIGYIRGLEHAIYGKPIDPSGEESSGRSPSTLRGTA